MDSFGQVPLPAEKPLTAASWLRSMAFRGYRRR